MEEEKGILGKKGRESRLYKVSSIKGRMGENGGKMAFFKFRIKGKKGKKRVKRSFRSCMGTVKRDIRKKGEKKELY